MSKRATINLSGEAEISLELASDLAGDSITEAINKGLRLYSLYLETQKAGGAFLIKENPASVPERVIFL